MNNTYRLPTIHLGNAFELKIKLLRFMFCLMHKIKYLLKENIKIVE